MVESLFLAVLQGLTEFLPISSSGHLLLADTLLQSVAVDNLPYFLVLHLATAGAALVFYRREISGIVRGILPPYSSSSPILHGPRRLLLLIAAASMATALVGLSFKDFFEGLFQAPRTAAVGLAVTGTLLLAASRRQPGRVGWPVYPPGEP